MASRPTGSITQLLGPAAQGDAAARDRLRPAVYEELRRIARDRLARGPHGCSVQATSLLHQPYERPIGDGHIESANGRHFFAAAAETMRRILMDDACCRGRLKRVGGSGGRRLDEPPAPARTG